MKYLVLVLALATVSFGYISHGPQVGIWLPTGDMADAYGTSFGVQYQLLYHMPVIAIEGSVGYVFLSSDFDNVDAHLIPITAGIRSYSGSLYAAGGLEYDNTSVTVETGGVEVSDSEGKIGAYFGAGMVNRMGFGKLDLSARAHWMDFDEFMISITGGINF